MPELSPGARELLSRPILGWATTLRADGSPHNTVVWVDVDGDDVVFNTAVGRLKEKHLRQNPWVSISVLDPDNNYHFVSVAGHARLEEEGADAMIDRLAKKYLGAESYPFRQPGEKRITVRIQPKHIVYSSGS